MKSAISTKDVGNYRKFRGHSLRGVDLWIVELRMSTPKTKYSILNALSIYKLSESTTYQVAIITGFHQLLVSTPNILRYLLVDLIILLPIHLNSLQISHHNADYVVL